MGDQERYLCQAVTALFTLYVHQCFAAFMSSSHCSNLCGHYREVRTKAGAVFQITATPPHVYARAGFTREFARQLPFCRRIDLAI